KAFQQELNGYRAQLAKPYMVDEEATERLIREAWERLKEDLRASHILVRADKTAAPADTMEAFKKALQIRERLLKGENFSDVAVEVSEDQSARDRDAAGRIFPGNKGDLGFFTAFDMIYPFENAAYALKKNDISKPVRTDFGYHIIQLTDRKPAMGKVLAAHILLLFPPNATDQDTAHLQQKSLEIYNQLISGASFDELAATFSDDRSTADKGGVLQWFGTNRMIPDFIEQIFMLEKPGDFTKPFQTQFGWHIVKLIDQQKPGSLDESYADLKEKALKNERSVVIKESLVTKIKKQNGYKEKRKALKPFYTFVNDEVFSGNRAVPADAKLTKKLFTIGSKKYLQSDFGAYLAANQKLDDSQDKTSFVNSSFNEFVEKSVLDYHDSQLEKKFPEFKAIMNEYHDGILLFELTDKKIWSKAVKDTSGLEDFYEKNRYNYLWGERADASIYTFTTNDKDLINKARELAEKHVANEEILAQINKDALVLQIQRRLFSKGDHELVDKVDWTYGVKEVTTKDGQQALVVIHNTLEPGPKQLNEARGLVTADYQNYLEKEWIVELRQKYPVKINYDLVPQISLQ
ncbi:MAG: peptidylprolyl isomerase, partial [Bacteroidales bacterium]|nr:peptidylprolyl isomerase [Bacteroidales bacterium]